ncbi:MAG: hypothetical protein KHZ77_06910 [Veillonella sp.]|uniref:hypothetical protein n=1 Tax=Veillonella sp. TaxID=1926307 RepID=UPI0025F0CD71|nr:hypothetical protein [Veillonella sp.]MBS4913881.1 hypothetical protein [Veillonella sp.]
MTPGMKLRRIYQRHKLWLILVLLVGILWPPIILFQSYRTYEAAEEMQNRTNQIKQETRYTHELVTAYDETKQLLLQRTNRSLHTDIVLYHILVEAGAVEPSDRVLLESVQFSDEEFIIKGRSSTPESGHKYVQRLKSTIKGVTITDKQGTDTANQMATFEVRGDFKRTENKS